MLAASLFFLAETLGVGADRYLVTRLDPLTNHLAYLSQAGKNVFSIKDKLVPLE